MFLFRVIDSCQEAFILRLYRQKNKVLCLYYNCVLWWGMTVVTDDDEWRRMTMSMLSVCQICLVFQQQWIKITFTFQFLWCGFSMDPLVVRNKMQTRVWFLVFAIWVIGGIMNASSQVAVVLLKSRTLHVESFKASINMICFKKCLSYIF